MTKKKILFAALALSLVAIMSLGSLAWFTAEDEVVNNFYIASSEDDPDAIFSVDVWEDDTEEDLPDEEKIQGGLDYENILPGDVRYKEVHIENTGYYDQYIRATVTITGASVWQDVYGEYLVPLTDFVSTIDENAIHTQVAYYDAVNDAFVYELYYDKAIAAGQEIIVFETVKIDERLDRFQAAELSGEFNINVVAHAVQTENVGDNVYEAFTTVGLVTDLPITNVADLAAALKEEGEARIILSSDIDWSANPITVDYAMADKTIDFNGQNGNIVFASGSSAENVVVTGIVDTDGIGFSVETAADFTGDLTINYCDFVDDSSKPFGAVRPAGGNVTIDNCSFEGVGKSYGVRTDHRTGDLAITNCTFTNFGSWSIIVNGTNNGNLTVDNCVFDTRDGVIKTLGGGVTGDFTFTNNTLIGCLGHDGKPDQIFVVPAVGGTKTVSGNTLDGADFNP